jgi:hypothetical protein
MRQRIKSILALVRFYNQMENYPLALKLVDQVYPVIFVALSFHQQLDELKDSNLIEMENSRRMISKCIYLLLSAIQNGVYAHLGMHHGSKVYDGLLTHDFVIKVFFGPLEDQAKVSHEAISQFPPKVNWCKQVLNWIRQVSEFERVAFQVSDRFHVMQKTELSHLQIEEKRRELSLKELMSKIVESLQKTKIEAPEPRTSFQSRRNTFFSPINDLFQNLRVDDLIDRSKREESVRTRSAINRIRKEHGMTTRDTVGNKSAFQKSVFEHSSMNSSQPSY